MDWYLPFLVRPYLISIDIEKQSGVISAGHEVVYCATFATHVRSSMLGYLADGKCVKSNGGLSRSPL